LYSVQASVTHLLLLQRQPNYSRPIGIQLYLRQSGLSRVQPAPTPRLWLRIVKMITVQPGCLVSGH